MQALSGNDACRRETPEAMPEAARNRGRMALDFSRGTGITQVRRPVASDGVCRTSRGDPSGPREQRGRRGPSENSPDPDARTRDSTSGGI